QAWTPDRRARARASEQAADRRRGRRHQAHGDPPARRPRARCESHRRAAVLEARESTPSTRFAMIDRRTFLEHASAAAAAITLPPLMQAQQSNLAPIFTQIERQHDANVQRLQTWMHQPSIAAENRGMNEGCELTMQMLRDAGFGQVTKIPSDGQPGIFATLDAGAPRTLGVYFMYDVKQVDPAEWSSPPWDAALVDKPNLGKVVMGRGAVNQKGPE